MKNFEAHTDEIRNAMLKELGAQKIEDIYSHIPQNIRLNGLNLPEPLSEMALQKEIKALAAKNKCEYASFLGAGAYKRYIPAAVAAISSRFEFNTAYTPYQPEISQGTLQIIYEYQSMICNLTKMEISNASVYDAATACAEAVLMASRINNRNKCLVSKGLNPQYLDVLKTYCEAADIKIDYVELDGIKTPPIEVSEDYACVLYQFPNFYGEIEDAHNIIAKDAKTLKICCADILSLALLEPPVCDIMVGDIQSLGNSLSFGGAYGGFMACADKYKRQLPGRIVGKTVDADGNQAFTLTLQTREQHIRREKATSNICSNQALVALQATVYLTLLGKNGLKEAAFLSAKNAHKLAQKLSDRGIRVLNKNYFNEFVFEVDDAKSLLKKLKNSGILGGTALDERKILVSTTELITDEDIEDRKSVV